MKHALRAAILVLTVLTGCNDEPAQRRALIAFLQEHIIWRPGVHQNDDAVTDLKRQFQALFSGT
jgi:hypothetical protein